MTSHFKISSRLAVCRSGVTSDHSCDGRIEGETDFALQMKRSILIRAENKTERGRDRGEKETERGGALLNVKTCEEFFWHYVVAPSHKFNVCCVVVGLVFCMLRRSITCAEGRISGDKVSRSSNFHMCDKYGTIPSLHRYPPFSERAD